jgi:hypothetical protein
MKKGFILTIVVVSSVFFFACEEDAIPVPLPPPPPLAQDAETPAPPPQSVPAEVATVGSNANADFKTAKTIQAPSSFDFDVEDAAQLGSGRYTIQVAVFPSEASAKALVKKMAVNGIKSYYARVNNPAQLLGTYYRVRIGYFSRRSAAEAFARTRLEPRGYAWWVDGSKNDTVGNPVANSVSNSNSNSVSNSVAQSNDSKLEEAKQAYKEMVKESAKEAAKEAAREAAKEATSKETAKKTAKKAAKEAAREGKIPPPPPPPPPPPR